MLIKSSGLILSVLFLLSVGIFFFLNMLYSTTINANLNAKSNYKLNQDYLLYIEKNISLDKTMNLHPILSRTTGGKKLLETYTYLPIDKHPDYIITIHIPEIKESSFISFNSKVSSFIGLGPIHPPHVTQIAVPNNYTLATQSGMIWIYKK